MELIYGGNGTFVPKYFSRLDLFPVINNLIGTCWTIGNGFAVPKFLVLYTSINLQSCEI
jgi:hypothetical protein